MAPAGLTADEVNKRKAEGKVNTFESPVSRSYADIIFKNFFTSFNLILVILGLALLYFDECINALAATGVIMINVLIATIQEMKAKRRLDKIAVLLRPTVKVIRDGNESEIDPSGVVMDDIVHLVAGDQAQVDGEATECKSCEMDESLLTGESSTRRKHVGDTVYSGAYCVTGECYYKVTALGEETFATKMLTTAKKFKKKKTPLQIETSVITEILMVIAFLYLGIMVLINIVGGKPALESLIQAVVILDIVPIALFLLITITYMIAAVRMADGGVLLQNSNSVESMSHVDTVCLDKTGTITTNNLVFDSAEYFIPKEDADKIIRVFVGSTGSRNRTVNALDAAFGAVKTEFVEEVPFSSDRKYSAVRAKYGGEEFTLVMGAYAFLKDRIRSDMDFDSKVSAMASKGLRTVMMCKALKPELLDGENEVKSELSPVALMAIMDEVRPDCKEIIGGFLESGMDLKVISGDDPETVDALFSIAEIPGERKIISGDALSKLTGEEKERTILETNIFGRMRPEQKEEVIKTLKSKGRYVAMVGDGVNDVRSLKMANVGVALQSGSGAARGVADMILVDDSFLALPKAITEGKRTVTGMRDILKLYLTRNFILAILIGVLLIIMGKLPMLPIQNTYYALVTVSFASFLIAIWAKPSDNKDMILPDVLRHCIPMSLLIAFTAIFIYLGFYMMFEHADLLSLLNPTWEKYQALFPDKTIDDFFDHLSGIKGADVDVMRDVISMNASLFFLVIAGISQLFLIYPFSRRDEKTGKRILFPALLALFLYGTVALFHLVPQVSIGIASVVIFPWECYLLLIAVCLIWAVAVVLVTRSNKDTKIITLVEEIFNRKYARSVQKEDEKDQRR